VVNGLPIRIDEDKLADLCRRWHIQKLWLFGSVLRPDFRPDSDIDVLVLFEEEHTPGLGYITLSDELEQLLERPVDLLTEPSVRNPFRRREIFSTRRLVYAA
jgi:predicted nucleotidyltransferase